MRHPVKPIKANPPKGGDAKPWVYRHPIAHREKHPGTGVITTARPPETIQLSFRADSSTFINGDNNDAQEGPINPRCTEFKPVSHFLCSYLFPPSLCSDEDLRWKYSTHFHRFR